MPALRHRSLFTSTVGVSWFSFTTSHPSETETRSGLHFENQTGKINFVGQAVLQFTHSSVRNKWKKKVSLQNEQSFFLFFINQIINVIIQKMHDYQCQSIKSTPLFTYCTGCCLPPAPVSLQTVQEVTQTAVTRGSWPPPSLPSPANEGSALMRRARSLRKDGRSGRAEVLATSR